MLDSRLDCRLCCCRNRKGADARPRVRRLQASGLSVCACVRLDSVSHAQGNFKGADLVCGADKWCLILVHKFVVFNCVICCLLFSCLLARVCVCVCVCVCVWYV